VTIVGESVPEERLVSGKFYRRGSGDAEDAEKGFIICAGVHLHMSFREVFDRHDGIELAVTHVSGPLISWRKGYSRFAYH